MNRVVARTATREAARRLGKHLKGLRTVRAWTQKQVAAEIGVDSVTLRRWELGIFSPSLENMERLATSYEVSLDSLMQVVSAPDSISGQLAVPIKGYVDAGIPRPEYDVDLGTWFLPNELIEDHPNVICRVVSGDSLTVDGIHHNDNLIIDPDAGPDLGRICIVRLGPAYCAAVHIPQVGYRWRTPSGRTESLSPDDVAFAGTVISHIRKM